MAPKSTEQPHLDGQLSFLDDVLEAPSSSPASPPDPVPPTAPLAEAEVVEIAAAGSDDANVLSGPNTRIRASNAMHRARAGAVQGALDTIARKGIRGLTMVEAADRGGLARATLYNHVRDKDALLMLVLESELARLAERFAAAADLETALADVSDAIATHPSLAGIRSQDPAALATLAAAENPEAREAIAHALSARHCATDAANVDLVLRWLGSFITGSSDPETRRVQAIALARTLR